MKKTYTINSKTMYIGNKDFDYDNVVSHVMETTGTTYEVNKTANRIIMENCRAFSSNYTHRKEITKHLTQIISKQPIMIDFIGSYIYFPMFSDRNQLNHWFNIKYIERYDKEGESTRVTFTNGSSLIVEVSYYTFERQYMCALKLFYKASQKREKILEDERQGTQSFKSVEADLKFLEDYRRHQYMNFMKNVDMVGK